MTGEGKAVDDKAEARAALLEKRKKEAAQAKLDKENYEAAKARVAAAKEREKLRAEEQERIKKAIAESDKRRADELKKNQETLEKMKTDREQAEADEIAARMEAHFKSLPKAEGDEMRKKYKELKDAEAKGSMLKEAKEARAEQHKEIMSQKIDTEKYDEKFVSPRAESDRTKVADVSEAKETLIAPHFKRSIDPKLQAELTHSYKDLYEEYGSQYEFTKDAHLTIHGYAQPRAYGAYDPMHESITFDNKTYGKEKEIVKSWTEGTSWSSTEYQKHRYRKTIDSGLKQPVPMGKELEGVMAHEYGHYLQSALKRREVGDFSLKNMGNRQRTTYNDLETYALRYKNDFTNEMNEKGRDYGLKYYSKKISEYGNSLNAEWFAEAFTHSQYYDDQFAKDFRGYFKGRMSRAETLPTPEDKRTVYRGIKGGKR